MVVLQLLSLSRLKRWEDAVRFSEKYYAVTKVRKSVSTTATHPPPWQRPP